MIHLADRLVATLPSRQHGLYNPYADTCMHDRPENTPQARLQRLRDHLECNPKVILVGEAPGYRGCRYSGVAFTSEGMLLDGEIPRVGALQHRLTSRSLPFREQSATIVWRTLKELSAQDDTVLWNALQMHPHRRGEPWSNRTPTASELALGAPALQMLRREFPKATFVPIGQNAHRLLERVGIRAAAYVRHPANGGAVRFAEGLSAILA
ncbi:MAG: hypothetical protein EOP38_06130 [Rubrivivax sp.]|nr:MAG: hypothetical protein EOP38_06130 [Rubrivivax sp.]